MTAPRETTLAHRLDTLDTIAAVLPMEGSEQEQCQIVR